MKFDLKKLFVSIIIPLFVGYLGSIFTIKEIPNWYLKINRPGLTPPNWVFGPVWTLLYILMGIAFYLVWTKKTKIKKTKAVFVFGTQLLLNFLWSILFFSKHWLLPSVMEIGILWVMILINILVFKKFSKLASGLLIPYLAWVSFASYLTIMVWWLN
jgi:tryptophan-rich sensory protein